MTYNAEQITYMLADAIDKDREYKSWHLSTKHLMTLVEMAVADEREACAKLVEGLPAPDEYSITDKSMWDVTCIDCAEAIRARGEQA
jgi:hypothetical protein